MLDAVKEQRTDCSVLISPPGTGAAEPEMFAGYVRNSLELTCAIYTCEPGRLVGLGV